MQKTMVVLLGIFLAASTAHATPARELVAAAKTQIGVTILYDGRYERIAYPNGDVPIERGVCTDVVIRAYRQRGIDLQALVHQDMKKAWNAYPQVWGQKTPDRNIDHRRVLNLAVFFGRHGTALGPSKDARAYQPGDLVTWRVPPNLPHIGIVADQFTPGGVPLVIHNIGMGTQMEDRLFAYEITGHYRFAGPKGP